MDEKYALIYTHRGIGIYTLKVADPTKDSFNYITDSRYIKDRFITVGDAMDAIDDFFQEIKEEAF